MVKGIEFKGKSAFECEVCNMKYLDEETAKACEAFCSEHPDMCDPKISEKALK